MKRGTAIRHLTEMAGEASEGVTLRDGPIGWPLVSLWAAGDLLDRGDVVDSPAVVLVLDLPVEEMPWFARHPSAEWVRSRLGLGKRPLNWAYRPTTRPAWNARHPRVLRFWRDDASLDDDAIALLREPARLPDLGPSSKEWDEQLRLEREQSWLHLSHVLDGYEERPRGRHRESTDPADELWRAAEGFREIEEALRSVDGPASTHLSQWQNIPAIDPAAFRADVDTGQDPSL